MKKKKQERERKKLEQSENEDGLCHDSYITKLPKMSMVKRKSEKL